MTIANNQIVVGTSATALHADAGTVSGAHLIVSNQSGAAVFLGDAGVTTSNGLEVPTGETREVRLGPGETLYGVVASGSSTVGVLASSD